MQQDKIIQVANQGGYQPAVIGGLSFVLNEGMNFLATERHVDFPNQILGIPKNCVGIIEVSTENPNEGTVSVILKDTITARRLIAKAQTNFGVMISEDRLKDFPELQKVVWGPALYLDGVRCLKNKIRTSFKTRKEAMEFYNRIYPLKCGAMTQFRRSK